MRLLLLSVAGMLCEGFDLQAAGVAAAGIVQEVKPDPRLLGWFFSASTIGLLIGAPVGGWLGDRRGRAGVVQGAMVLFALSSVVTGLSSSVVELIVARLATGLGLGGAMPNLIALAAESGGATRAGRHVSIMFAGTPIGGALASLVAAAVGPAEWRWVFVAGGVIPLVVAAFWRVLAADAGSPRARASGGDGARPALTQVAFGEGRAATSLLLWAATFASLLLLYLLLNWLPLLLVGLGLEASQAAVAQVIFNVAGAAAAAALGLALDGRRRTLTIGAVFVLLVATLVLLSRAQTGAVVALVGAVGAAVLGAQATVYALGPAVYPAGIRGTGVGLVVGVGRLGSIAGPLLAASLVGVGRGSADVIAALVPIAIAGGLCAVMVSRRV